MRIALIDPLSLVGKELCRLLPEWPGVAPVSVDCYHTAADDEHQISELGGAPALVAPLDDPAELASYDAVLVASDHAATPRLEGLAEGIRTVPSDLPVIDTARVRVLRSLTRSAIVPDVRSGAPQRYRMPAPAVVATIHVLEAAAGLAPLAVAIHSEEPASAFGANGIEDLAAQASARLQGEAPKPGTLPGTLAFNLIGLPAEDLLEDAQELLAPVEVSVTRSAVGRFHGHVVHLAIALQSPATAGDFEACCRASESLRLIPGGVDCSTVPDSTTVLAGPPSVSADGRLVSVTAAVDGLLLGGARTALELLAALV